MFACGIVQDGANGTSENDDSTFALPRKNLGRPILIASAMPRRIVVFGAMTRTRPREIPKGSVAMIPVLRASDGDLNDGVLAAPLEVLAHALVRFTLGLAESLVLLYVRDGRREQCGRVLLRALILKAKRLEVGAPVVSVVVPGVPDRLQLSLRIPPPKGLGGKRRDSERLAEL